MSNCQWSRVSVAAGLVVAAATLGVVAGCSEPEQSNYNLADPDPDAGVDAQTDVDPDPDAGPDADVEDVDPVEAVVETLEVDEESITKTSATLGGRLVDPGAPVVADLGICRADDEPAEAGTCQSVDELVSAGEEFEIEARELSPGTHYVFRAWASQQGDRVYADHESFTTVSDEASAEYSSITGEVGAVADGIETAEITIELRDDADDPVEGVVPGFEAGGEGNEYHECSETDGDGISTCEMTTTTPGSRQLSITEPVAVDGDSIEFVDCDELGAAHTGGLFGGGDGSEQKPYLVCTAEQFERIGDHLTYEDDNDEIAFHSFELRDDIDLDELDGNGLVDGFENDEPFGGTLDGGGHEVTGLQIGSSVNEVGLFEAVGDEGVVTNLKLLDVDVSDSQGYAAIGTVAAYNHGEISEVEVSGNVASTAQMVPGAVGGVVGSNTGEISAVTVVDGAVDGVTLVGGITGTNEGSIEESSASVDVTGEETRVGGAVGFNDGEIEDVTVEGDDVDVVTGKDDSDSSNVGGVVGLNEGDVSGVEASVAVEGDGYNVGGVVGDNEGTISESLASGDVRGREWGVGGFAGLNSGEMTEVEATGEVQADASSDAVAAGGLVGASSGVVRKSSASGFVEGAGGEVGGLAGHLWDEANVEESKATGDVVGEEETGGLVGWAAEDGTIVDSYATGDVEADEQVGGLVGRNDVDIDNCYSTGEVEGNEDAGGLIGDHDDDADVEDSYWDVETSGIDEEDDDSGAGTPLQTDEFAEGEFPGDWDFDDIWEFGGDPERPVLQFEE